nr:hypothetical transcript [Hymenolepis microstoma]
MLLCHLFHHLILRNLLSLLEFATLQMLKEIPHPERSLSNLRNERQARPENVNLKTKGNYAHLRLAGALDIFLNSKKKWK